MKGPGVCPRCAAKWLTMADYQRNGARLGWLLLPEERAVEVWTATGSPQRLEQIEALESTPECPGLQLQLAEIWAV